MLETALGRRRSSLPVSVLGVILVTAGSVAALWQAANLVSVVAVAPDLPRGPMIQYFVANTCDVLWCTLMAVSGYCLAKRRENAAGWLIASSVAWIPGTAVNNYQAWDIGEFMAQSRGTSVAAFMFEIFVFRVVVLVPNLAASAVALRRGATHEETSPNRPT